MDESIHRLQAKPETQTVYELHQFIHHLKRITSTHPLFYFDSRQYMVYKLPKIEIKLTKVTLRLP